MKCEGAFIGQKSKVLSVEKTSENFSNFKVMNNEAMKQIKIASSAKITNK